MKWSFPGSVVLIVVLLLLLSYQDVSAQCAMCKQAAASSLDNNPNSLARGLNSGILYLMAVPYILLAFLFRKQIASLYKRWRHKAE